MSDEVRSVAQNQPLWRLLAASSSTQYSTQWCIDDDCIVLVPVLVDDGLRSSLNFKCPIPCPANS